MITILFFSHSGSTTISLKPNTIWIKGNTNQSGFYRMNYDTETWRALIEALKTKTLSPAERASLIDDAFHVFRYHTVISSKFPLSGVQLHLGFLDNPFAALKTESVLQ